MNAINIQIDCKMLAMFDNKRLQKSGKNRFALIVAYTIILLSGTVLYGQEYMRPDGTTGTSRTVVPEALPGDNGDRKSVV